MREYLRGGERRLWFKKDEIEQIMEDQLCKSGMFPDLAHPSVDIESFLEFHLEVKLNQHAVLEPDVLGVTGFPKGCRPLVRINKALTSEAEGMSPPSGQLGRWRATMAHEGAHVVLHRGLFEVSPEQGSLFHLDNRSIPSLMRCLNRNVSFSQGLGGDWKEVQANRGMAALLMPKRFFSELVRTIVGASSTEGLIGKIPKAGSVDLAKLLRELSSLCEVSQEAARIRLETLDLISNPNEPMLRGITA